MKKVTKISILWMIGSILEWINVVLFIAAMGYDVVDFSLYNKLKEWEYINMLFYICAGLAAIIFGILVRINKKSNNLKDMSTAVFCCVVQLILVIYKVKL